MTPKNFIALSLVLLLTACVSPSTLKTAQLEAAKQNAVLMLPLYIEPKGAADVQSADTQDLCTMVPQKIYQQLSEKMPIKLFGEARLEDGYCRVNGDNTYRRWLSTYQQLSYYIPSHENADYSEAQHQQWNDIMGLLLVTILNSTYLEETDMRELNANVRDYLSGEKCYKDACYIAIPMLNKDADGLLVTVLTIIDVRNGDIIFNHRATWFPELGKRKAFEDSISQIN